jgi:mannitol-specific phosphotransferase system IIBC component
MKKLLTLLFAVAVAFSLTMPVFAQETTAATTTTKAKKTKAAKATKAKKTKKTTTATTTAP